MATVLITGANRGIGRALVDGYAKRGDRVIALVRSASSAQDLGHGIEVFTADVTDEVSLAAAAARLSGRAIDILICNAGMHGARGAMADPDNSMTLWTQMLQTNVAGVFFTARAFAPQVAAAKGRIAVISSRMGSSKAANGNSYVYRASKAAAANVAANLAVELKARGVALASFHPGWVQTDMGGAGADITAATSASGLMAEIDKLSLETTGAFLNYDGTPIAF